MIVSLLTYNKRFRLPLITHIGFRLYCFTFHAAPDHDATNNQSRCLRVAEQWVTYLPPRLILSNKYLNERLFQSIHLCDLFHCPVSINAGDQIRLLVIVTD